MNKISNVTLLITYLICLLYDYFPEGHLKMVVRSEGVLTHFNTSAPHSSKCIAFDTSDRDYSILPLLWRVKTPIIPLLLQWIYATYSSSVLADSCIGLLHYFSELRHRFFFLFFCGLKLMFSNYLLFCELKTLNPIQERIPLLEFFISLF